MLSIPSSHHCANCKRDASPGQQYCGSCGRVAGGVIVRKELPSDPAKCVRCSGICRRDSKYCTKCGDTPQYRQWEQNLIDDYDEMWRQDEIKHRGW